MAGIKRWWFERSIVPQVQQSHYFQGRTNKHIGIVTDVCEDFRKLNEFILKEKSNNNKINLLQLKLKNAHLTEEEKPHTIGSKNVNWYGVPKSESCNYFLEDNYDICYFLFKDVSLPAEYILRTVKSGVKLGFAHKEFVPYLDFCIDSKEDINGQFSYLLESASKLLFGTRKHA